MKRSALLAALLLLAACNRPTADPALEVDAHADDPGRIDFTAYGDPIAEDGEAISPADLAANPAAYDGQRVRVEGTIVQVCQQKGCWMTLENGTDEPIRVHVPKDEAGEYRWTLPMDLGPQHVIVEGTAEARTVDVDERRHYAEDAGRPQEEIDAITIPQQAAVIHASGILVERTHGAVPAVY
jgi:hypothetical protein